MRIFDSIRLTLLACATTIATTALADSVIYSTDFEFISGFDSEHELVGQSGWTGYPYYTNAEAVNSSGIISNQAPDGAQEAYVGYFEPNPPRSFVSVWRPLDVDPTIHPEVKFEVLMTIYESSTNQTNQDSFRWSVYNSQGDRLFAVDFDNFYKDVSYALDDGGDFVPVGQPFTNDLPFHFSISMDFLSNRWSAAIEGIPFISDKQITTTNAPLNLGDVDAVWSIYDTNHPGDNYLTFDDYRIVATPASAEAAWLESLGRLGGGFVVRLHGTELRRYAVEASTNLNEWIPLKTNIVTDAYFDLVDQSAAADERRFYRGRAVP